MKKYLFLVAATVLLVSCNTAKNIYQVYEVKSNDVQNTSNGLVYENNELKLTYDFCSEGGDMSFYCYNKTEKTIYISLPESFFIRNGIAYDYYNDCDYTSTTVTSIAKNFITGNSAQIMGRVRSSYLPDRWYIGSATRYTGTSVTTVSGKSEAVTTHSVKIIAIPAHSAKLIPSFLVYDNHYIQCGEDQHDVNYPKKQSPLVTYNENTTPIEFVNSICYTFDINDKSSYKNITNTFYLASLQNFNESEILTKNPDYDPWKTQKNNSDECKSNSKYIFNLNDASKFYNKYLKK